MTDWSLAQRHAAPNFEIGQVFGRSFQLYGRKLPVYYLLTLAIALPNLYAATQTAALTPANVDGRPVLPPGYWQHAAPVFTISTLFYVLQMAVLLHVALQDIRGRPFDLGQSLTRGLLRMLPILATILLAYLAITFGAILLFFPGIMVWMMLSVSVQACLDESPNPFTAMGRSAQLTKGHRWSIFGIELVFYVVVFGIDFTFRRVLGLAFSPEIVALLNFPVSAVFSSYGAVLGAVMYQALREAKEGVASDHIATVFD